MSAAPMKNPRVAADLACRSAVRPCRASRARSPSASRCRGRTPAWRPAGRPRSGRRRVSTRRLWMPSAAAPISSPCSAMRLRSRQVSWRIGSIPRPPQRARRRRGRRCTRAPAPSVTLTASAQALQRGAPCAGGPRDRRTPAARSRRSSRRPRPSAVVQAGQRRRGAAMVHESATRGTEGPLRGSSFSRTRDAPVIVLPGHCRGLAIR